MIELFNDTLSDLRRSLYHRADEARKKVLKGSRWLLLKSPEHLDPERDEAGRLEEALRLSKPLAIAYYLKEDLRQFWEQPGKRFATALLDGWLWRAEASGVRMLQQMAETLESRRAGRLAYYDYPISTGLLEGTDTKIETMKRQAYGFRDHEFFEKILAIHETKYALVGRTENRHRHRPALGPVPGTGPADRDRGFLAEKKRVPATSGTLRTDSLTFAGMLLGTVLLVGELSFLPAVVLGPVADHLYLSALEP